MSGGPFRPRGHSPEPPPADPPPPDEPPERRRPAALAPAVTSQATWILGVVVVLVLAYITVNTIRTDPPGSRGLRPGTRLPPFAAPLATGTLEGDANVLLERSDGVPAACDVRGPQVFNVCEAGERGPLVLAFMATRSRTCIREVDVLDRLRRRFPGVQFAVVVIRGNRDDVRRLVRERGWHLPVAYDRDGAVSNAYAVAVCPTITFARRGGEVADTLLGGASRDEVVRRVEAIR
jgi:hypothetical protein